MSGPTDLQGPPPRSREHRATGDAGVAVSGSALSIGVGSAAAGGEGEVGLREVEWTDLATLSELEQRLFADDAWPVETWWAELAERPRREYVAAVDEQGAILGYAGLDLAGESADVMTIAVVPEARGRGLGDHLLTELVRRCELSGIRALLLEVRADNETALRLYERNGFERISRRRRYYQPGDVDALVLRKHLGGDHD